MDFSKPSLVQISPKTSQDGQGIPYSLIAFSKFRDITDYIGQGDAPDTFIPKRRCVHQEMFDDGLKAPDGGFFAAIPPLLFRVILKQSAIRIRKSDNVPWSQRLPLIRFPCCDTFHDRRNFPNILKFNRVHGALLILLLIPGYAIVDTFGRIYLAPLLLIVSSDGDHAAIPILLTGFLGVAFLKYAIIRLLRHIRYGYGLLFWHVVCLLS